VRRQRDDAHEFTHDSDSSNTCRDLDHAVGDQPEFLLAG
jgi:hypothetical protein